MITDEQKINIKAEEIYRAEVKKELNNNQKLTLWKFLNSAFGIWVLSTIIVGLLSLAFTQWKENQIEREKHSQALQLILEEGQYRMTQLDASMNTAFMSMAYVLNELRNNNRKVSGELINKFLHDASILSITIQLGGVTHIPPLKEARTVKIGNRAFSSRNLPFAQGYKYSEYKHLSLFDITRRAYKLKYNKPLPEKIAETIKIDLDELLYRGSIKYHEDIFKDWFKRTQASGSYKKKYQKPYDIYKIQVDDYESYIMKISSWMVKIKEHLDDHIRYRKELVEFQPF